MTSPNETFIDAYIHCLLGTDVSWNHSRVVNFVLLDNLLLCLQQVLRLTQRVLSQSTAYNFGKALSFYRYYCTGNLDPTRAGWC